MLNIYYIEACIATVITPTVKLNLHKETCITTVNNLRLLQEGKLPDQQRLILTDKQLEGERHERLQLIT